MSNIAAFDFDGTITLDDVDFPYIGSINPDAKLAHDLLRKYGWKIILWTCRTDEHLRNAIDFSSAHGITFDAYNDHLVMDEDNGISQKIFATAYIDDRNVGIPKKVYPVQTRGSSIGTAVGVDWMEVLDLLGVPTT